MHQDSQGLHATKHVLKVLGDEDVVEFVNVAGKIRNHVIQKVEDVFVKPVLLGLIVHNLAEMVDGDAAVNLNVLAIHIYVTKNLENVFVRQVLWVQTVK